MPESFLAGRLRRQMEKRRLTQVSLARAAGVSPAAVRRWLKGEAEPAAERRAAIASALALSEEELFSAADPKEDKTAALMPLSIGNASFESLRAMGQIYVDKTGLIGKIASEKQFFFLARPRRFGKTLLISTFESLFKSGTRDFAGLDVERNWSDRTYPVVSLTFSLLQGFDDIPQMQKKLVGVLKEAFSSVGFVSEANEYDEFLTALRYWLARQPVNSLVLLIDEYDAPLTEHLDDGKMFEAVRVMLLKLFSSFKAASGVFRFFFMTGITKFSSTGIFSAFNNLTDLSLSTEFSSLLGYTETEIVRSFGPYLDRAQKISGLSRTDLLGRLRTEYDGYCFDLRGEVRVYNPWSLTKYLAYPADGFKNYWYETGGQSTLLLKYLRNTDVGSPESFNSVQSLSVENLSDSLTLSEIEPVTILAQAGYLSICGPEADGDVPISFPNNEVRSSFASLYSSLLLGNKTLGQHRLEPLSKLLAERSPEEVFEYFNRVVNVVDSGHFPLISEAAVQAAFQFLMIGAKLNPLIEKPTAAGRSDLEVRSGKRRWVFEFKYAADGSNPDKLLLDAVNQIRKNRYGVSPESGELIRMALVYGKKERAFVRWAAV